MASPAGARNSLFRATALGSRARGSGREIIIACRRTSMPPRCQPTLIASSTSTAKKPAVFKRMIVWPLRAPPEAVFF